MADVNEMRQKFFQGRRADIDQAQRENEQSVQDQLRRKFASIGQSGSGAEIGATIKAQGDLAKQRESALRNLSGEELQSQIQEAESQRQRDFQGGLAGRQEALQREQMAKQGEQFGKQFGLAEQQFALDKETTAFNRAMAEREANKEPKGLFGGGGFLGTGLDVKNPGANFEGKNLGRTLLATNPVTQPLAAIGGGK